MKNGLECCCVVPENREQKLGWNAQPPSKNSPVLNISKETTSYVVVMLYVKMCVYILDKVNWIESRMMPTKMTLLQGSGNEREIRGAFPNSLRVLPTFLEDVLLLSLDPSKIPICNVFFPEPKMISILYLPYNRAFLATFLPGLRPQSLRIPLNGGSADWPRIDAPFPVNKKGYWNLMTCHLSPLLLPLLYWLLSCASLLMKLSLCLQTILDFWHITLSDA